VNAIETQGLTRAFGDRVAVQDLTLSVPQGTIFGFLGPNGAGKTTTVRMLAALIAPTSGTAFVNGYRLGADNDAIRRSMGILTETPGLYERLSARQNLLFFAQLHDLDGRRAALQIERYLRMLDLWERRDDAVGSLSKGMRQKLAIARALLHEPPVLFLDEPTSNLDPEAARTVRQFIRELRDDGRTIFMTTHNLPEVDQLCDLICVFRGRMLRLDSPANLRQELFGKSVRVRLADGPRRWLEVVQKLPYVHRAEIQNDSLFITLDDPERQNPSLLQRLVLSGAQVRYVEPVNPSLEEVYLKLIGDERHGAHADAAAAIERHAGSLKRRLTDEHQRV
jgi:ABC-2 type transport system ATP-binding protein